MDPQTDAYPPPDVYHLVEDGIDYAAETLGEPQGILTAAAPDPIED